MRAAIMHGPNLNRLGKRRPEKYGTVTLAEIGDHVDQTAARLGGTAHHVQSNHEGELIDWLQVRQDEELDAIVINPAGLTAVGFSLLDAVRDTDLPFAVVHISQYHAIDGKERPDIFADTAAIYVTGVGWRGYAVAYEALFHRFFQH